MFFKNEALEFWRWLVIAWRQWTFGMKPNHGRFPVDTLTLACFPLCLKVQKRPTNLRPCSRRCSHAKSVLGSWEMSEKSCLTLRVANSVRCRELQERQYYTKKLYDVIMMYIHLWISVNLNFFEQNFQSSFVLSSQKKHGFTSVVVSNPWAPPHGCGSLRSRGPKLNSSWPQQHQHSHCTDPFAVHLVPMKQTSTSQGSEQECSQTK